MSVPERCTQVAGIEMATSGCARTSWGQGWGAIPLGLHIPKPQLGTSTYKGQPARISSASYILLGSQPLFPELEPARPSSSEAIKGENQHPSDLVYGAK